jgi:hypothetical protein
MKKISVLLCLACASVSAQAAQVGDNVYNPAVGLILNGTYAAYGQDPVNYTLSGFPLVGEAGPVEPGFALGESELNLSSNIDNLFYGHITAAFAPEGGVEVEESYIRTLALGGGFNLKAGRFLSNIGYLNSQHAHQWDFVDAPLAYRGMLANRYLDDGVQVTWLAPTDLFMELSGEALRGDGYPAAGAANNGQGAATAAIHFGGDVGSGGSWRAGYSLLSARAQGRGEEEANGFSGDTTVSIVDLVWKWAPNGNPRQRNLIFQTEYLQRNDNGTYDVGTPGTYDGRQSGWYAQLVYQFMPRWRVGLRYDALSSDNSGTGVSGTQLDSGGHNPSRSSVMVDFSNSEYSRLRLQYNDDHSSPVADGQFMLQYIMSLGAHGAHQF